MSYDIYLVRTRPGEEPAKALDRLLEEEDAGDTPDEAKDLLWSALAADSPVDVEAGEDFLLVTIPYIRSREAGDTLVREVVAALRAVQSQTGWAAFDPQLDRALNLTTDVPTVVRMFDATLAARDEFA